MKIFSSIAIVMLINVGHFDYDFNSPTRTIYGVVTDSNGKPRSGVQVVQVDEVIDPKTTAIVLAERGRRVFTDYDGEYELAVDTWAKFIRFKVDEEFYDVRLGRSNKMDFSFRPVGHAR